MASTIIKVRLPLREVKRRFAALPAILSGQARDPHGLKRYFHAVLARFLYQKIHAAYRVKALGGSDELGNSWRPLAKSTIKRRLSPSYLEKFPKSAKLLILRVSDRLYRSFRPGRISGSDYVPVTDQLYDITPKGFEIGSTVEYAAFQHKKRPLWPRYMKAWIKEGIDVALGYVFERLARIMSEEK